MIVFKSLLVVHFMIREGQPDVTLSYLSESPKRMAISSFVEGTETFISHTVMLTRERFGSDIEQRKPRV